MFFGNRIGTLCIVNQNHHIHVLIFYTWSTTGDDDDVVDDDDSINKRREWHIQSGFYFLKQDGTEPEDPRHTIYYLAIVLPHWMFTVAEAVNNIATHIHARSKNQPAQNHFPNCLVSMLRSLFLSLIRTISSPNYNSTMHWRSIRSGIWCQNKYSITCNRYIYIFVGVISLLFKGHANSIRCCCFSLQPIRTRKEKLSCQDKHLFEN